MIPRGFFPGLLAAFAATASFAAEGKVDVRYAVSFTGISVGQGALIAEVTNEGYSASGSGAVTGMLKILSPGKGTAAARGRLASGKVLPATFTSNSESGDRWEDIRLSLANGTVKEATVLPPRSTGGKDRVQITDQHLKNVLDPMSAALMPVAGSGSVSGPDACNRTLPIYDGRLRYDLVLKFERTEQAKDIKGFSGPLAVCRVAYVPVAGHRTGRQQTKAMADNNDIFVWLAPIGDTRVLLPAKVTIGSSVGTLTVQATQFSSGKPNGKETGK